MSYYHNISSCNYCTEEALCEQCYIGSKIRQKEDEDDFLMRLNGRTAFQNNYPVDGTECEAFNIGWKRAHDEYVYMEGRRAYKDGFEYYDVNPCWNQGWLDAREENQPGHVKKEVKF